MFALAGCKSKDNTNDKNANNSGRKFGNGNFDPSTFKQKYEDALKTLVTDGKITQDQSDKVLVALTKNMGNFKGGTKPANGDKPSNNDSKNSSSSSSDSSGKPTNEEPGKGRTGGRNNQLAELVTSKVITQAQADEIMEKIRGNMGAPSDGNSQSQNSNQ